MLRSHRRYLAMVPVLVLVLLLALPSVALADNGVGRFSVFNSVSVGPGETINGDVGSIFSSVSVQGTVRGNVFSVFSSVSVSGNAQVDGTVTSVFSSIAVRNNAVVRGDVTSVFSNISKDNSARIEGTQTSGPGNIDATWPGEVHVDWGDWRGFSRWDTGAGYWIGRVFGGVFSALILAAVSVLVVVLFPRRVEVVKDTMVHTPWSSLGVGFLGLLLSFPLALVLLITCVGFFIVIFGTFLATLLGLVAIGLWVGDRVMDTASTRSRSLVMDVLVGSLILALVMAALDIVPVIGWMSGLIWFGLFSIAFGSVLLSRFGTVPPVLRDTRAAMVVSQPPANPEPPAAPPAPPAAPGDTAQ